MDFGGPINIILSLTIMLFFIYLWGKVKRQVADKFYLNGIKYIKAGKYVQAVKELENAGDELKYDSMYWYYLALALLGAGSESDCAEAVSKSLKLDSNNTYAKQLQMEIGTNN